MNSSDWSMRQTGFTLIELLVTILVISLLMMVAVPGYQNYVIKTKVSAELAHLSPVKTAIVLHYNLYGELPSSNKEAKLAAPNEIRGTYLKKIEIKLGASGGKKCKKGKKSKGKCTVNVIMTYDLPELGKKNKLIFAVEEKNHRLLWRCKELTTIENSYRPSKCMDE